MMERETGFEPATSTLARSHSTTELLPLEPAAPKGTMRVWSHQAGVRRRQRVAAPKAFATTSTTGRFCPIATDTTSNRHGTPVVWLRAR